MAVKTIYEILDDYSVSPSTPDYTSLTFDLKPQGVLAEEGQKNQIIHVGEDDSEEVIILADTPWFYVTLSFAMLTPTNAGFIYEMFFDSGKGNGFSRSFIWIHPKDGITKPYKVRFADYVPRDIKNNYHSVNKVYLKVLGLSNRCYAGTHTGANDVAILTDSTKNWTPNILIGQVVHNVTDGSSGTITANTDNTVTATLAGGTQDDWDNLDAYYVSNT